MSSRRTAQSARIPDLSRLTIKPSDSAMPVTTRSMRRDRTQTRSRLQTPARQDVQVRNDDDDNDSDDSNQEASATQLQKGVLLMSLHFAAMVPSAWCNAQMQDGTPESIDLLQTINTIGRYAARDTDLFHELSRNRRVSVQDRAWPTSILQMLSLRLDQIRDNFPPRGNSLDVPDTAKALVGWLNAMRNIWCPLKLFHAGRASTKDQFSNVLLAAWEFVIESNFDISEVQRYQPSYTRPPPYGNNLFRTITEGGDHGTFGLDELDWALAGSDSPELIRRAIAICRYILAHQPVDDHNNKLREAVQRILQTLKSRHSP